ncbi:MAG: EAL domain-containing protein [Butyrivibrio sp.]
MSRQKDRRLKKLRKQRVWPYILGIILVVTVFFVLSVMIATFFMVSVMYNKLQIGYGNALKAVEKIEQTEDEAGLKETCDTITNYIPDIEGICIVNQDKDIIFQYGDTVPDWNYTVAQLSSEKVGIIFENDEDGWATLVDGQLFFWVDRIADDLIKDTEFTIENFWSDSTVTAMRFWYEIPSSKDGMKIYVKDTVKIKSIETAFMIMVINVIIVMTAVLVIYYLISIISLVFERRKLAAILATDVVTGGFNLQYFTKKGTALLKKNLKKQNYVVVNIRMEKYRNFCSSYGTKEGEELLEKFYLVLKKELDKKELAAHGDKADFALLLTFNTEEELIIRLEAIIEKMQQVKAEQKKYFSIGYCTVNESYKGLDSMYNNAGVAISSLSLDSDKRIVRFNDKMQSEQLWVSKVENDMERALRNKEFQVYLQPKYSTKDETISGAEALVRWIHPEEGFVPPYRFIPIFEKNGFIIQLDDYMITEVARLQSKWIAEGKEVVPISVNVSRVHFIREDLAEHICQLVDQFNVPHSVIELELTESAFFDDKSVLLNTITKLKEYGFEISMDDFGSGYSSLNSLKELPLDVLKLDAGFFREADENGRGRMIVGDTISLAKKLDMRIVAEGIETREQVDLLASMDCDLIQGYYFAKPMPVAEFEEKYGF